MSLDADIALLASVRFFEGFGPEEIRLIAFGVEPRRLADGERLFKEGAYSDGAYVVRSGALLLSQEGVPSVTRHGPPDIVAPLALVSRLEHAQTATAEGDGEVVKISRQLFRRVLEEYPHLASFLDARIRHSLAAMGPELDRILAFLEK